MRSSSILELAPGACLRWALLLLTFSGACFADAGSRVDSVDPRGLIERSLPGWITPALAIPDIPVATTGSTRMLLVEEQYQVSLQDNFRHFALRVESEAGLQQAGQISVDFAPAYQRLRWHYLRILRDGAVREVLAPELLQVLRQEQNADRFLYHGRLTVLALLRDLRVGDVVEWAYSRTGENPVLGGRFCTTLYGAGPTPVDRLFYRILTTAERELQVAPLGAFEPEHRRTPAGGDLIEHTWTAKDLKAVVGLPDAPGFEPQYPFVQISEFASWAEVAEWARPLFVAPAEPSPELQARIKALTESLPALEEKANAVLRFVQDDVRYLGIHFNESTHRPTPPDEVLQRRFGDCKDKSLLLVTLLRSLGLQADVALVNSGWSRGVRTLLPSPLSFDHAIVRVTLPTGMRRDGASSFAAKTRRGLLEFSKQEIAAEQERSPLGKSAGLVPRAGPAPDEFLALKVPSEIWLDPTSSLQGGRFVGRSVSDFGFALVLTEAAAGLTRIPLRSEATGSVYVKENYTVTDLSAPAHLEVVTTYSAGTADAYRYFRRFTESERYGQQLMGLLARLYPKIKAQGTTEWTDDRDRNVLVARTRFEVPEFWPADTHGRLRVAELYPWALSERLPRAETTERAFAFALPHPLSIVQETEINLPTNWPVQRESKTVSDDTFAFSYDAQGEGNRIRLTYRWHTLADSVPAPQVPDWTKKMAEVRAHFGYRLTHNIRLDGEMKRSKPVWSLIGFGAAGLIGGVVTGVGLYRWPSAAKLRPPPSNSEHLTGIGGWLILVAIGVTLRPFTSVSAVLPVVQLMGNWPGWLSMTDAESASYVDGWASLVWAEAFMGLFFVAWTVIMVVQFYRRKASLPMALVALFAASILVSCAHLYWMGRLSLLDATKPVAEYRDLIQQVFGAVIWGPYLLQSRRVRATFRG